MGLVKHGLAGSMVIECLELQFLEALNVLQLLLHVRSREGHRC